MLKTLPTTARRSPSYPYLSPAERSYRTRRTLLDVGREVFTALGYVHTTVAEITQRTGVTLGALCYHYPNKRALFGAVYEEVCQEYSHAVWTYMQTADGDTWERFVASMEVLIDRLAHPSVRRIVCVDGPVVLEGLSTHRQTPERQFLRAVLPQLRAEGVIKPLPLDPCLHIVWGMCRSAALHIAEAEERAVGPAGNDRRAAASARQAAMNALFVPPTLRCPRCPAGGLL